MRKALQAIATSAMLATATVAGATPSTTFWTPATTYTQPFLVPHITYDTYFAEKSSLQIGLGLTVAVLALPKLQAEVGVDVFYPTFFLTTRTGTGGLRRYGKLTLPEGAFAKWSPGLSVEPPTWIQGGRLDYHLLHATLG
jgi:hypothetical protein